MFGFLCAPAALRLLSQASLAQASGYPARSTRMVVASTPGGAIDGAARLLAAKLGAEFG